MIYLALFLLFVFVGICITYDRHRKRILKNHDPNKPFTSQELRQIGIIPPENYDDWLDKYASR